VLAFIGGLILTMMGATGQRATHRCSCGYDLTKVPKRSTRCPECGARRGHPRAKDPHLLNVGIALLVGATALVMIGMFIMALSIAESIR